MLKLADVQTRIAAGEPVIRVLRELSVESQAFELQELQKIIWKFGAPAQQSLDLLERLQDFASQQEREVSLAKHRMMFTARIVISMPVVTLFGCQLIGLNPVGYLFSTLFGWLAMASALTLIFSAWQSSKSLISQNLSVQVDAGFEFELEALKASAGAPTGRSVRQLQFLAQSSRKQQQQLQRLKIAELPEKLMLRNTLFLLPAAVILCVVPIALNSLAKTVF